MSEERETWKVEAVVIPTVDDMRKASYDRGCVSFTFGGLGRVSVKVVGLEEASVPMHKIMLTGMIEQPVPRLLWWLKPKEVRILHLAITCFPYEPSKSDIGTVTVLGKHKV